MFLTSLCWLISFRNLPVSEEKRQLNVAEQKWRKPAIPQCKSFIYPMMQLFEREFQFPLGLTKFASDSSFRFHIVAFTFSFDNLKGSWRFRRFCSVTASGNLYVTVLQQKYVKIFIEEPQFPAPGAITLWSFRFSRTTTWKITEVMQGYNIMFLPSKAQKHPSHFSESVGFHGELVALRPKPKLNFAVY